MISFHHLTQPQRTFYTTTPTFGRQNGSIRDNNPRLQALLLEGALDHTLGADIVWGRYPREEVVVLEQTVLNQRNEVRVTIFESVGNVREFAFPRTSERFQIDCTKTL